MLKPTKRDYLKNRLIFSARECQRRPTEPAIRSISPSVSPSPSASIWLCHSVYNLYLISIPRKKKKSHLYESCVAGAAGASLSLPPLGNRGSTAQLAKARRRFVRRHFTSCEIHTQQTLARSPASSPTLSFSLCLSLLQTAQRQERSCREERENLGDWMWNFESF